MFASPGNNKLPKFVSRNPHWQNYLTNALVCPLSSITTCYANPPWGLIFPWLVRLWENPHITCLMVTPMWVSTPWWPLLVKMQKPGRTALVVQPHKGMFQNCWGEEMPAPRWPLLFTVLSGACYKERKCHLKQLTHIYKV